MKTSGMGQRVMEQAGRRVRLFAWAVFSLAAALPAVAAQSGDLYYEVEEGTRVTITGYAGSGGALVIPPEIGGLPVTRIEDNAFSDCVALTGGLVIPDGITQIGNSAFSGCSGLTQVALGSGVTRIGNYAFLSCSELTGVLAVPSGVTEIGDGAFIDCAKLTGVVLGDHVARIGMGAFDGCGGLTGTLTIPDSVTDLGVAAFFNCRALTGLVVGNGVVSVGRLTFSGCSGLGGVLVLPGSVTSIGASAFDGCAGLTGLMFGDQLNVISEWAFAHCSGLTGGLTLPDGLTSVGHAAFAECDGLTGGLAIPDSVTNIGNWAFAWCRGLTSLDIGNGVTHIGDDAFQHCDGLKELTLGNRLASIGSEAFVNCSGLTGGLTIPDSVTDIGSYSFQSCDKLTYLMAGIGLASVGESAFRFCSGLTAAFFKGDAPGLIGANHFSSSAPAVYYVDGRAGWGADFGGRPTAVWTSIAAFDADGGTEASFNEFPYEVGNPYMDLPETSLYAHTFLGWWTEPGGAGTEVTMSTTVPYLTEGHSLYAKWIANTYEVMFEAQGGTVNPASATVTYGEAYGQLPIPFRLGYAFGGWWTLPEGTGTQVSATDLVTTGGDHTLYAKWTLDASEGPATTAGVAYGMTLPIEFAGAARVTVKGLPTGLKYNAATRKIEGVPTKAGTFGMSLSAAGIQTLNFTMTVEPLPAWAWGTFNGAAGRDDLGDGTASMSVTALGKVTGKMAIRGVNYGFSAASYARRDENGAFWLTVTAKAGQTLFPLTFAVYAPEITAPDGAVPETLGAAEESEDGADGWIYLRRDVWKDAAETLLPFTGYYTATLPGNAEYGSGYLTCTVDKAGKVKVGGKLADGTAVSQSGTLILDEEGSVFTVLYAAPAAYKGGNLFGVVEFFRNAEGGAVRLRLEDAEDGDKIIWDSFNPQATDVYDEGFSRELGIAGGWYSKTGNLYDYYQGKALAAGTDAEAQVPGITVGANRYASAWWNPDGIALTPTLDKKGVMTGLAAPAAGKPTDLDKNGVWDYGAANAVGLKVTLTRPTGVFKGSSLAWFDYPFMKHVSKSISYEGVLTPEREDMNDGIEGRGFFLWPDKAVRPAPAKPYSFNWSYDFLLLGE